MYQRLYCYKPIVVIFYVFNYSTKKIISIFCKIYVGENVCKEEFLPELSFNAIKWQIRYQFIGLCTLHTTIFDK